MFPVRTLRGWLGYSMFPVRTLRGWLGCRGAWPPRALARARSCPRPTTTSSSLWCPSSCGRRCCWACTWAAGQTYVCVCVRACVCARVYECAGRGAGSSAACVCVGCALSHLHLRAQLGCCERAPAVRCVCRGVSCRLGSRLWPASPAIMHTWVATGCMCKSSWRSGASLLLTMWAPPATRAELNAGLCCACCP